MNIFKEARISEMNGMGYRSRRYFIIYENPKISWNWVMIEYGIRWSDKIQLFPIWNTSNNSMRSITIGIWKIYLSFVYHRKYNFIEKNSRNLIGYKYPKIRHFYQLIN